MSPAILLGCAYMMIAAYLFGTLDAMDGGLRGWLERAIGTVFAICWPLLIVVYVAQRIRKRFARVRA